MRLFSSLYARVLRWANHRHAQRWLGALSFAEATFFPIPPDVMLAPMTLAAPARGWRYAALATLFSALGGVAGYLVGLYLFDFVQPLLWEWGYEARYLQVRDWFERWGAWAVFVAGFTPIPYKIFTIAAGVAAMPLAPFAAASLVGRGARFFLVVALARRGGAAIDALSPRWIERIGWTTLFALGAAITWFALS